jgi:hypothetical protein
MIAFISHIYTLAIQHNTQKNLAARVPRRVHCLDLPHLNEVHLTELEGSLPRAPRAATAERAPLLRLLQAPLLVALAAARALGSAVLARGLGAGRCGREPLLVPLVARGLKTDHTAETRSLSDTLHIDPSGETGAALGARIGVCLAEGVVTRLLSTIPLSQSGTAESSFTMMMEEPSLNSMSSHAWSLVKESGDRERVVDMIGSDSSGRRD